MFSSSGVRTPKKIPKALRDLWDKADTIAKFLSSVVIATVGILITWSIQRTQIDTNRNIAEAQIRAAEVKAQDERRFQENQMSVQLVNHLISADEIQRQIAIITLRQSVPPQVYDSIVQVLARRDQDSGVRTEAIKQLAASRSPQVTQTLRAIVADYDRPTSERQLAARATEQVILTSGNESGTYVFVASRPGEIPDGGSFTQSLIRGLTASNIVTARSLGELVQDEVPKFSSGGQTPVFSITGSGDAPLFAARGGLKSPKVVAIVIGISSYQDPLLPPPNSAAYATAMAKTLRERGAEVTALIDADREAITAALSKVARDSTDAAFVIYFSGHSSIRAETGVLGWLASDSSPNNPSTWISIQDVKVAMSNSQARTRWLFVDSTSSGDLLLWP
jgi:hypothetical protein